MKGSGGHVGDVALAASWLRGGTQCPPGDCPAGPPQLHGSLPLFPFSFG